MLSYQHMYHAASFADVVKHLVLTRILAYLTQKDKPLFYIDTHSGRGLYSLNDRASLKTSERTQGIDLIWDKRQKLPTLCQPYIEIIQQCNPDLRLNFYPGSPFIAQQLLRPQDRMVFCDLHPQEFSHLQSTFKADKRIFCKETDGISQLKALLPPKERRGLIFIDPTFEVKTEYKTIPDAIKNAFKQFATGTYCLWYPIIDRIFHKQLINRLALIEAPFIGVEFKQKTHKSSGMTATGLWVINPPYTLQNELKSMQPVWDYLGLEMELFNNIRTCSSNKG